MGVLTKPLEMIEADTHEGKLLWIETEIKKICVTMVIFATAAFIGPFF